MQANELIYLAALIAVHGASPEASSLVLAERKVMDYWTASKCRIDRWLRALQPSPTPGAYAAVWNGVRGVVEEIFLGEVLTRVWTGFVLAHEAPGEREQSESVARSVLMGHLEARHRALSLLMHARGVPLAEVVAMNQLRRKTERWTDLLLGQLSVPNDLSELAAEPNRMRDFAQDWRIDAEENTAQRWSLLLASLRNAFPLEKSPRSPNADLNERIAASIVSCFPSDAFEMTGPFHSLWMLRLRYAADDAQGMLDQLCRHDQCPSELPSG